MLLMVSTISILPYSFCLIDFMLLCYFRLSRARRVVENLFGILANRWRMQMSPDCICDLAFDMLTLNNLLQQGSSREIYSPNGLAQEQDPTTRNVISGTRREPNQVSTMVSLGVSPNGHNVSKEAKQ